MSEENASASTGEHLLTPTKITAWLDCAHYLTLKHAPRGANGGGGKGFGSFARLLQDKGVEHERNVLEAYLDTGRTVRNIDARNPREPFEQWADRVAAELGSDADVLFQMPFVHDGVRGIADFLERRDAGGPDLGWEPVDAKLARTTAKPSHVLQLCFYAEAIHAATGVAPADLRVSLGSGHTESIRYEDVRPYWARLRAQLRTVMDAGPDESSVPRRNDHCTFCEFEATCDAVWREQDSLVFVAGIRRAEQLALEDAGVNTLAELAAVSGPIDGLRDDRLGRLRSQAALQLLARAEPDQPPPFDHIAPGDHPTWGHGFELLPQPDAADVFLDFEGDPFWRPDQGLFFLFGYVTRDKPEGPLQYHAVWAHDEEEERAAVKGLVERLTARRSTHPGMHVYHYNHTERSALETLAARHTVAEAAVKDLVESGAFVDLYAVTRNALQIGVESYGLKHVERLTDFERSHGIDKGAGAVVAYEQFMVDGEEAHLESIARYNEDDVRATAALRDWLVGVRPDGMPWREARFEVELEYQDVDALVEQLAQYPEGSEQRVMAELLAYWIREWKAYVAPLLGKLQQEPDEQLADPGVLAGLADPQKVDRLGKKGKPKKWPGMRMRFPDQPLSADFRTGADLKWHLLGLDGRLGFATASLDLERHEIEFAWNAEMEESGAAPTAVAPNTYIGPGVKVGVLTRLANQLIDPTTFGEPGRVALALLRGEPPTFVDGGGPDGMFSDGETDLARWVTELDHSVLPVQGPPGTGKTFRGAHMAKALVRQGKRVGVMAMSHHAIDNFVVEIAKVFAQEPAVELKLGRRAEEPAMGGIPGVSYVGDNKAFAGGDFDIVATTSWGYASKAMQDAPVDVLLIDEAGQLALVDAVVASTAAKSVVLLGDPQQLAQVSQAVHPGVSGRSALRHLLGEEETILPVCGVFIEETRRMHPDVCRFVSERIYDGRLHSHPDCSRQTTSAGTGLRWLRVAHDGCATESMEEAEVVGERIRALLGTQWTDKGGIEKPLTVEDVLVVAPYNDQVRLLRAHLDAHPRTRGVPVGTVDKFQGRQAPVVFFTMTSSTAADMPRGTDFLFSRNRLNVAVSRAQCLAYLVCTEELLSSRARTVDDMLLIATLCAFVEYAEPAKQGARGDHPGWRQTG